jgi:hypothetical protein
MTNGDTARGGRRRYAGVLQSMCPFKLHTGFEARNYKGRDQTPPARYVNEQGNLIHDVFRVTNIADWIVRCLRHLFLTGTTDIIAMPSRLSLPRRLTHLWSFGQ